MTGRYPASREGSPGRSPASSAAGDLDDRRVAEVPAEAVGVDRRRGDDQLQLGPLRQDPVQAAEQEVDVQAALVRLVDDHGVVAAQQRIGVDLGQ